MFFTFFKVYKWNQIAQNITYKDISKDLIVALLLSVIETWGRIQMFQTDQFPCRLLPQILVDVSVFLTYYAQQNALLNSLSTNRTKWSNTLKQFVGNILTNCLSMFDHSVRLMLKGFRLWTNITKCRGVFTTT